MVLCTVEQKPEHSGRKSKFLEDRKEKKITQINGKIWILNYLGRNGIHTQVLDNKVLRGTKYFYLNEADAYQFRTQLKKDNYLYLERTRLW